LFRGADGKWQVYVVRDGRARLQPIATGLINDEQVEVRTGVSQGEQLVLAPETNLVDGTKVKPIEREARLGGLPVGGD
jgi:HlyD family secretion protein